jgi:hypothetical protein
LYYSESGSDFDIDVTTLAGVVIPIEVQATDSRVNFCLQRAHLERFSDSTVDSPAALALVEGDDETSLTITYLSILGGIHANQIDPAILTSIERTREERAMDE